MNIRINFKYFLISLGSLLLLSLLLAPHTQPLQGSVPPDTVARDIGYQTEFGPIGTGLTLFKRRVLNSRFSSDTTLLHKEKVEQMIQPKGARRFDRNFWLVELLFILLIAYGFGRLDSITGFIRKTGSLKYTYHLSARFIPWLTAIAAVLLLIGLIDGLVFAPIDAKQKDAYRIIFIHVPASSISLQLYVFMALMAAIGLIWHIKIAEILAAAAAPLGAALTAVSLITGSIWGGGTWNTFWEWGDPRMMSVLILLFIYMSIMGLNSAIEDRRTAASATAILTLSALVIIPFVILSVNYFNTLHQAQTQIFNKNSMDPRMARPLVIMIFAFMFYTAATLLARVRAEIIHSERNTQWVSEEASRS